MNTRAELKSRLHAHVANMSPAQLKVFALSKCDELEEELLDHELSEENVSAHLLRVSVLMEVVLDHSENKVSKVQSDAGWAAENARWERESRRQHQWESMGS